MEVFDETVTDIFDYGDTIEQVFTKDNIFQSLLDSEKNGWNVILNITEYPAGHKLSSYITLFWQLSDDTFLGNKENTAGFDLEYVTATFDCDISTVNNVKTVTVTRFAELEIEHIDATIGLDANLHLGRDGQLGLAPIDFESTFKKALSDYNDANLMILVK